MAKLDGEGGKNAKKQKGESSSEASSKGSKTSDESSSDDADDDSRKGGRGAGEGKAGGQARRAASSIFERQPSHRSFSGRGRGKDYSCFLKQGMTPHARLSFAGQGLTPALRPPHPQDTRRMHLEREAARATQPRSAAVLHAAANASPRPGLPDASTKSTHSTMGRSGAGVPGGAVGGASGEGSASGSGGGAKRASATARPEDVSLLVEAGLVSAALRGEPDAFGGDTDAVARRESAGSASTSGAARQGQQPHRELRADGAADERRLARPPPSPRRSSAAVAAPSPLLHAPPQPHFADALNRLRGVRDTIRERQAAERRAAERQVASSREQASSDTRAMPQRTGMPPLREPVRDDTGPPIPGGWHDPASAATPRPGGSDFEDLILPRPAGSRSNAGAGRRGQVIEIQDDSEDTAGEGEQGASRSATAGPRWGSGGSAGTAAGGRRGGSSGWGRSRADDDGRRSSPPSAPSATISLQHPQQEGDRSAQRHERQEQQRRIMSRARPQPAEQQKKEVPLDDLL